MIKDDIAKIDLTLPTVPAIPTVNANSIGVQLNAGWHFDGGADAGGLFFEPIGTISYVRTTSDGLTMLGTAFKWEEANSLRGRLGVRIGDNLGSDTTTIQPFLYAGIGEEFLGDNHMTFASGGESIQFTDKPVRTFGLGSIGVNVFGNNGWSGFIKTDGFLANHSEGYAVRLGLKYTFGEGRPS